MSLPTAYHRGYQDALKNQENRRHFEQTREQKEEYSAGFAFGLTEFQKRQEVENEQSPAKSIVDAVLEKSQEDRFRIFEHLVKNPGFGATFGTDPVVEFGPVEIFTDDPVSNDFNPLDEHRFEIRTHVTVKVRKDVPSKAVDRRVRKIKELREELGRLIPTTERYLRVQEEIDIYQRELLEHDLRLTEEGNLESV